VVYVALAMAAGLALGHPNAAWTKAHQDIVGSLTAPTAFSLSSTSSW